MVSDFSEELYSGLAPAFTDEYDPDWTALSFVGALGTTLDELWDVIEDNDVPWTKAMSPTDAPAIALGWLAGLAGVLIESGWTEEQTREAIRTRPGQKRGTPAAIIAAAQRSLTGTKHVVMNERDSSAYHLTIRTYTSETPNSATVLRDILTQKPAGIVLNYATSSGRLYSEVGASEANYTAAGTDFSSYNAMRSV